MKTLPAPPPGETFEVWDAAALNDGKALIGTTKGAAWPYSSEAVKLNQTGNVEAVAVNVSSYTAYNNNLFPGPGNEGLYVGMWEGANLFRVRLKTDNTTEWLGLTPTPYTGKVYRAPTGELYVIRSIHLSQKVQLLKISSTGNLLWEKEFNLSFQIGNSHHQNVIQTSDGGALVGLQAPPDSLAILKLDANGNQQWLKKVPATVDNNIRALQIGNTYFLGSSPRIYKFDLSGNKIGELQNVIYLQLISTADGNLLLGTYDDSAGFDMALKKISPNGNLLWSKVYEKDNLYVYPRALSLMPDGGFLFAGDGQDQSNPSQKVVLVVRTDANGDVGGGTPGCSPDVTPPVISGCPSNISITSPAPAVVNWTPPTAADNCGTPTLTSTYQPGSVFPFGTTTVAYTATDGANNMATCSFTVTVTEQVQPPSTYCLPYSNFPWEDWIAGVRIGTQEKTSGKSPYSDYSQTFNFNLSQGSNQVTLTSGFSYFHFDEYWRIWIDFNRDGDFNDAGEMVLSTLMPKTTDGPPTQNITGNISIPTVTLPGATRMRVVMKRGAYASPCENIPYGEIEDYSVNITAQGACKKDIPGGILCFEKAPAPGQSYLLTGNQGIGTRYTVNKDGEIIGQSPLQLVAEDSTLVQNNMVVRKLANGTIAWQKPIGASVLNQFPTIEAAVELNDGTFILGGFQRQYDQGNLVADSAVFIKTDNALNYVAHEVFNGFHNTLTYDKVLGFVKTMTGDAVAVFRTASTYFTTVLTYAFVKFTPQLQVNGSYGINLKEIKSWYKTPCGYYNISYDYNFPSIKNSYSGTTTLLFDFETMTTKTNRTSQSGSVAYMGSYYSESYYSTLFGDTLSANYYIAPGIYHIDPFTITLKKSDGTIFEKRPALIDFNHIVQTGDTTVLFLGNNWALNPDCGSPGTKQSDLSMANLALQSTSTSPGAVVWFNFDLKNTGNTTATGEYIIAAYMSNDKQLSNDDLVTGYINTGNTPVGTIPGVLGGITVPVEVSSGQYYLLLKVDVTGVIVELNEANNELASAVPIAVSAGSPENCGFESTVSSDGFSTYGAASINGHHVFKMSKYDAAGDISTFRNVTVGNDGVVTGTDIFSLNEKLTPLADENFVSAVATDPNIILLKKVNKAGTPLWVRQLTVSNAVSLGEVSVFEAANGDILLTGVYVENWYSNMFHKVFFIRTDYNGNRIYSNDFSVTPDDEPNLTARFFKGYNKNIYVVAEKPSYLGQKKPYLLKIGWQSANLLWKKEFYDFTQIRGIAETSDDATLVTTFHPGAPGGAPNSTGNLYKIDANGNEVFNKNLNLFAPAIPPGTSYGPVGDAGPIMKGTDGGFITGFTRFFPYTSVPSQSIIIRLNSNLDTLWTRAFNSPDDGVFKTFRAVPGGAFLGTKQLGSFETKLIRIGANGQTSPCGSTGTYCTSTSNFPWEDWIARVQLNTLDNSSGKSPYSNFTALSTTLQKDHDYTITLTTGFSYFTWPEYWNVWIDYNHDGVFTEPDELAFSKILSPPAAGTPQATVSGTFKLPTSALTGPTRMRITMKRNGNASPCETIAFGEIEDYAVNIVNNFGGGGTDDRATSLSFEAVRERTWVKLDGMFHSREAVAGIFIEKSLDGQVYETLESAPGSQRPDAIETMRTVDKSPVDGFNFYRMKMVLENGTALYSPVRTVSFDMPLDFTIFPNPASTEIFIQLSEPPSEEMTWTVYDALGRPIWSQDILPDAAFPYRIDMRDFEDGMYYLYAQRAGKRAIGKRFVLAR
ncbi:MAG: HYR domain-containing protein [Saprospiraceae bacterium]|nr:HYR domain-containing protein [Saprospiraceae bacterium]